MTEILLIAALVVQGVLHHMDNRRLYEAFSRKEDTPPATTDRRSKLPRYKTLLKKGRLTDVNAGFASGLDS